jgi:hypothetical protein
MGIRKIQTEQVLEDVARLLLAGGVAPTTNDILKLVSDYFSLYPPGTPLPFPIADMNSGERSNVRQFNQILAHIGVNLDVLYEASAQHVDQIMDLHAVFNNQLKLLKARRRRLESQIDDYLLSQYNTDGYYFSISDVFSDITLTDLSLTSAHVDTELESVILPTFSGLTKVIPMASKFELVGLTVKVNDVVKNSRELGSFSGALDGMTNTFWAIEVETAAPAEVVVTMDIALSNQGELVTMSRIDYDPYGMVATQVFVETANGQNAGAIRTGFGQKIETSLYRMAFSDSLRDVTNITITLRKNQPDYTISKDDGLLCRYVFGAKEIACLEHVYDNEAVFVSKPLQIPATFANDFIIDAVSIVTDEEVPPDTSLKYYVAADVDTASAVGDFNWKPIVPIGSFGNTASTVIRFDGAHPFARMVRSVPVGPELQLISPDSTNDDLAKRNPSAVAIPGADIWRLCAFEEEPLLNSLSLEEGVNSSRISYTNYNVDAVKSLAFWESALGSTGPTAPQLTYGRIDTGNDFFYGGDVGRSNASVYVETYLEVNEDRTEPLVAEFRKSDPNSQTWDVRVLLNGRTVGWLPVGTNRLLIPWPFQRGLNHISLLVNIPPATVEVPNPYIGTLSLLGEDRLYNYGTVKLNTWNYVDPFDLQYNSIGSPTTFTILNKEIVSRRMPTDNFRIKYATPTNAAPTAIRVRADMERSIDNPHVTPLFKQYRLRFAYGAKNV